MHNLLNSACCTISWNHQYLVSQPLDILCTQNCALKEFSSSEKLDSQSCVKMHPRFRTRIKASPPQWSARQYWICAQGQSGLQKDIRPEASFSQNRRSCYTDLKVRMESRSSCWEAPRKPWLFSFYNSAELDRWPTENGSTLISHMRNAFRYAFSHTFLILVLRFVTSPNH